MQWFGAFCRYSAFGAVVFGLLACSRSTTDQVQMLVIQPVGANCQYKVDYAPVETLTRIEPLEGEMGRVVYQKQKVFDAVAREDWSSFKPLDVHFAQNGTQIAPLDMTSLFAGSLYSAIESSYRLFRDLDPSADMKSYASNLSESFIVHNAHEADFSGQKVEANASFVLFEDSLGINQHFFVNYPHDGGSTIPLGLNVGVIGHEYAHMVWSYLISAQRKTSRPDTTETKNTLGALNEGMADYFGYLLSQDPNFVSCSLGTLDVPRDLSQPKSISTSHASEIRNDNDYDIYRGGAVWAAAQYEIGRAVGFTENGKALVKLFSNLLDCPETRLRTENSGINFSKIAACHQRLLGSRSDVRQIYNRTVGATGN